MRINKGVILLISAVSLIMLIFGAWRSRFWDQVIRYETEKFLFSETENRYCISKDIDGDMIPEKINFIIRTFPSRAYSNEGFIEIVNAQGHIFRSDILGNEISMARVYDINHDEVREIVSRWGDGNAVYLHIYRFNKIGFEELLWASARDVKTCDIDKDGKEEIIEYWRDPDKESIDFLATIYIWNGKEYALFKSDIPIILDPLRGDRLILGKNKMVVLK